MSRAQVSPGPVVVGEIRVQPVAQVGVVEHHHVIETLAAQGPDETLHVGILPWGPRGDRHLVDPEGIHSARGHRPVHRIAVAEQISGRGVPRERLRKLRGRPLGRRGIGHVDVDDAAPVGCEDDDEDEQHLEHHRG